MDQSTDSSCQAIGHYQSWDDLLGSWHDQGRQPGGRSWPKRWTAGDHWGEDAAGAVSATGFTHLGAPTSGYSVGISLEFTVLDGIQCQVGATSGHSEWTGWNSVERMEHILRVPMIAGFRILDGQLSRIPGERIRGVPPNVFVLRILGDTWWRAKPGDVWSSTKLGSVEICRWVVAHDDPNITEEPATW